LFQTPSQAQGTATVFFDTATTVTIANSWTSVLYVNGTAFPMTHTCTVVGALTTCTSPLPNISAALTPTGNQTLEVTFKDVVLGESPRSVPLVLARPNAPLNPRIR